MPSIFYINLIEGAWSHINRQFYGTHRWISDKHLGRYVSKMTWRYNRCDIDDSVPRVHCLGRSRAACGIKELIA
ncbi:transposase [Stappia sp. MMSF_3263]|uniref:transposase n=1 Tax=Stappia sp. MMSF_3263 TaxID=3046693 RepID=UPI0034DE3796